MVVDFVLQPEKYANGDNVQHLDGCLIRIAEAFHPDSENHSMQALYHCNHGYAYAEAVDKL